MEAQPFVVQKRQILSESSFGQDFSESSFFRRIVVSSTSIDFFFQQKQVIGLFSIPIPSLNRTEPRRHSDDRARTPILSSKFFQNSRRAFTSESEPAFRWHHCSVGASKKVRGCRPDLYYDAFEG